MTRTKLENGQIYLIKDVFFVLGTWSDKHNLFLRYKVDETLKINDRTEWVKIDPGLVFNELKSEQGLPYSEFEGKK